MSSQPDATPIASEIERIVAQSAAAKTVRAAVSPRNQELYELEKAKLDNEALRMRNSKLQAELSRDGHLHLLRICTLIALFLLVVAWLGYVIAAVWLSAKYGNEPYMKLHADHIFKLSDNVLIAFITSTTVSVIGIFLIAAKWLFPQNGGTSSAE